MSIENVITGLQVFAAHKGADICTDYDAIHARCEDELTAEDEQVLVENGWLADEDGWYRFV